MKKCILFALTAFSILFPNISNAQTTSNVTVIAGNGSSGAPTDGVAATSSSIQPLGVAVDAGGNVYVIDRCRLRKIDASTGIISTIAGSGTSGFSGDGGPATASTISSGSGTYPSEGGLWCNSTGDIFIADVGNNRVRKIDATTGIITTVAGGGTNGDGFPATTASLSGPTSVTTDAAGNMYITCGTTLRKVTASTGIISTVPVAPVSTSGFGAYFTDVKVDTTGNIYLENMDFVYTNVQRINISSGTKDTIIGPAGTIIPGAYGIPGSLAGFAAAAHYGLCLDRSDNLYIGDGINEQLNRLDLSTGLIYKAETPTSGAVLYVATDTFGNVYYSNRLGYVKKYAPKHVILTTFYTDQNSNCSFEPTDNYMFLPVTAAIDSAGVPVDTITATSGFYYIANGPVGTVYTVRILSCPSGLVVACPSSGVMHDTLRANNFFNTNNIGFNCSSSTAFDLGVYTWAAASQTSFRLYTLPFNNFCAPHTATVTMTGSAKYNYDETRPVAASISGNIATWNYSGLSVSPLIPPYISVSMLTPGSIILTPGDTAKTKVQITPVSGDADTTNNTIIRVDTIRAGYDPNCIEVTPGPIIPAGTELTYTIHFENTGNDTAHNIHVINELPDELDVHSFKMVAASAVMNLTKYKNGTHNVIKFDFPEINLLDSSYHRQNEGMFVYRIKTKAGLPDSTWIKNKAGIYFDINPVIWTNEAVNMICNTCVTTGITHTGKDNDVLLYPNPATDQLTIKTDNDTYTSLSITNTIGQQIMQQPFSTSKTTVVDVKMLPPGLYYFTLRGEQGSLVKKFVKI